MNDNPVGTPNPLQPSPLDANPSEPAVKPLTTESFEEKVVVQSLDPEGRPMEKAPEKVVQVKEQGGKKKKTGLVIGLIICLFVAVGCGVAAVLFLINSGNDPVSMAVEKLLGGDTKSNVAVKGNVEILISDKESPVSKVEVYLDSQLKTGSLVNATSADVTLLLNDGKEMSFAVDEMYSDDKDLYLRIQNNEVLLDYGARDIDADCEAAEGEEAPCITKEITTTKGDTGDISETFNGVLEMIDGDWIRISDDKLRSLVGDMSGSEVCMLEVANRIGGKSSTVAEYYKRNPFISSTTENITLDSRLGQLRQVVVDTDKLRSFINQAGNAVISEEDLDCLGVDEVEEVSAEDLEAFIRQLPAIYLEVNPNNDITRVYSKVLAEDMKATITMDFSISYPATITISEPYEYIDYEDLMEELSSSLQTAEQTAN